MENDDEEVSNRQAGHPGGLREELEIVQRVLDVITRSGSLYRLGRDRRGRWWLQADNVANPHSRRLDPRVWWHIRRPRPWPPELGKRLWLLAPEGYAQDDPRRIPGGGKRTSPVRVVRRRATDEGEVDA